MKHFVSRSLRLLGRALQLRCPNCGLGKRFSSWFSSKALFLAFDLAFRPATHDELSPPAVGDTRAR